MPDLGAYPNFTKAQLLSLLGVTGPDVLGTTDIQTVTNKDVSNANNTFRTWANADIATNAAVAWTKISKSGSAIADIGGTSFGTLAAGDSLTHNGSNWINSQVPRAVCFSLGASGAYTTSGTRYFPLGGTLAQAQSTETLVQATIPYTMKLKRVLAKMAVNTSTNNTTIALRDDTTSIGSITVGTGTTEVDSGAIDTTIASGSKVNFLITTSGTPNFTLSHALALCVVY